MMIKINCIQDISKYEHLLPENLKKDVYYRIGCWLESGGSVEDDYIKQQCRFIEYCLNKKCADMIG